MALYALRYEDIPPFLCSVPTLYFLDKRRNEDRLPYVERGVHPLVREVQHLALPHHALQCAAAAERRQGAHFGQISSAAGSNAKVTA